MVKKFGKAFNWLEKSVNKTNHKNSFAKLIPRSASLCKSFGDMGEKFTDTSLLWENIEDSIFNCL